MRVLFLAIFALMAFFWGALSASTKFCAKDVTSTPEPAPSDVRIFCALALLAAAICAEVCGVVELVEVLGVVVLVELVVVVVPVVVPDPTAVVAM